ncbi:MAG: type III pantothenate kinase [Coriobacteriia bacterium]|nr:type III pantothenate kinase [Coriobacteriia bacterium]
MLLAIDIGNTQTVLGLFEGQQLRHTWRLASDTTRTSDELKAFVTQLFFEAGKKQDQPVAISRVIVASVVPALTRIWADLACDLSYLTRDSKPVIVDASLAQSLCAPGASPQEVGADRIANALAARTLYGAPAIVVDFGTATNIDVIDAAGLYLGGIISVGIQTGADALFRSAARLPVIDLAVPERVLGTNTKQAVQSGILYGEAAKVDALIAALKKENPQLDRPDIPVIATGGFSTSIVPLITAVTAIDEHLTLKGLQILADQADAAATQVAVNADGGVRP